MSVSVRAFVPLLAPAHASGASNGARRARGAHRVVARASREADQTSAPLPRRSALFGALAAAAAAAAMSSPAFPPPAFAEDAPASLPDADVPAETSPGPPKRVRKNVIITGANSGIGFDGAAKLAALGYDVTLACRTEAKARDAIDRIRDANPGVVLGQLRPAECDLANFASVRRFAAAWRASGEPLDALVLNAGVQYSGDDTVRRTADGLEITVGTNHLGHFLLTNLMLPDLESAVGSTADGSSPRVVVTASEVHDPASPGGNVGLGAGLGGLAGLASKGADFEMLDGSPYNADKAYKDSKLCNVLFARELERRLEARGSAVTVNAFGPGLITRTGFFRYQNPIFVKLFDVATNDIFHVAETVDGGGDCLVYMVVAPELERRGGLYYNNGIAPGEGKTGHKFAAGEVSEEARDDAEAKELWRYSEQLVGLASIA